jgi:hypothetical protein
VKDETVQKDDQYKSHAVHVPSGEPPHSRSRPLPRRKAGVVRPITQGKRLKKGGPSKVCCIVADQYIILTWGHSSLREPGRSLQRSHYRVVLLLLWRNLRPRLPHVRLHVYLVEIVLHLLCLKSQMSPCIVSNMISRDKLASYLW